MEATEIIRCRGHPLVSASHPTTFEITKEPDLTENGHCIIGVNADKGAKALSAEFRTVLCHNEAVLVTTLCCKGMKIVVRAFGNASMTLDHDTDLVWRRSNFVCRRTVGIRSDTVAGNLPEEFVRRLKAGEEMVLVMTATRPG